MEHEQLILNWFENRPEYTYHSQGYTIEEIQNQFPNSLDVEEVIMKLIGDKKCDINSTGHVTVLPEVTEEDLMKNCNHDDVCAFTSGSYPHVECMECGAIGDIEWEI